MKEDLKIVATVCIYCFCFLMTVALAGGIIFKAAQWMEGKG